MSMAKARITAGLQIAKSATEDGRAWPTALVRMRAISEQREVSVEAAKRRGRSSGDVHLLIAFEMTPEASRQSADRREHAGSAAGSRTGAWILSGSFNRLQEPGRRRILNNGCRWRDSWGMGRLCASCASVLASPSSKKLNILVRSGSL